MIARRRTDAQRRSTRKLPPPATWSDYSYSTRNRTLAHTCFVRCVVHALYVIRCYTQHMQAKTMPEATTDIWHAGYQVSSSPALRELRDGVRSFALDTHRLCVSFRCTTSFGSCREYSLRSLT